jgi:alkyl sulfatase BDS1-like metallo-beta-lactamase superfamily hydrolase
VRFLSLQRDLYAYLHDQTLRLLNAGYTGIEIAEMIELPPALEAAWHTRGYYGSVSHNVKAIYQRYLDDGDPRGVLVHYQHPGAGDPDLTLTKPQLRGLLAGGGVETVSHEGDLGVLQRLLSVLETLPAIFPVVTP